MNNQNKKHNGNNLRKPKVLYPKEPVTSNHIMPTKTIYPANHGSYNVTYISNRPYFHIGHGGGHHVNHIYPDIYSNNFYIMPPPKPSYIHHHLPPQPVNYVYPSYQSSSYVQPQNVVQPKLNNNQSQGYQYQGQPHKGPNHPQVQPIQKQHPQTQSINNQIPLNHNIPLPQESQNQMQVLAQDGSNKPISHEEYLKQVEELKIAFGYSSPKQDDIVNEPYLNIQKDNDQKISYLDNLLEMRFKAVEKYLKEAKSYMNISWPLWELPLSHSKVKTFKLVSSKGKVEREILDPIDCGWEIIGNDKAFGTQSLVSEPYLNNKSLEKLLSAEDADLDAIFDSALNYGVPNDMRTYVWQLALGYFDTSILSRGACLKGLRTDYFNMLSKHMVKPLTKEQRDSYNYISLDSPRTRSAGYENIYELTCVRESFERIVFVWSCENKKIGYFQGLNEITSVILTVFLETALSSFGDINETFKNDNSADIPYLEQALYCVEPDVYYCMDKVMKMIAAYHPIREGELYSQSMCTYFEELVKKLNVPLWNHLTKEGLTFFQFSFRWFLCMFVRELDMNSIVCLWDTLICVKDTGFTHFPIYFAVVYLLQHTNEILKLREDDLYLYIFSMATKPIGYRQTQELIVEAFDLQCRFQLNIKKPFSLW